MELDLRSFGGSALTDDLEVPKNAVSENPRGRKFLLPMCLRNTILLFHLLWVTLKLLAPMISLSGRMPWIILVIRIAVLPSYRLFENLANLATAAGTQGKKIDSCPLIHMTKAEIIKSGMALGVDYSITHSCYDPIDEKACGQCDSCILRAQGFADAGVQDPTPYASPRSPDLTTGSKG